MTRPSFITFDVYGTLTRWDEKVADAFTEVLADHGRADAHIGLVCEAFEAKSRRLQTEGGPSGPIRASCGTASDRHLPPLA
ncbi:hypothetical protein MKL09_16575 [Methylobacterium sp. J-048]|uniref:hypothetical protein n=1 Tax=Methylobacterium sp. J-048 TaxID=2836635 RepID=UPI001FBA9711|nr:hypothetical protein [Methylobacterium sp. J-048]MCJ2058167.1 hypothetical protein [Methylobacterium sp. J-048]